MIINKYETSLAHCSPYAAYTHGAAFRYNEPTIILCVVAPGHVIRCTVCFARCLKHLYCIMSMHCWTRAPSPPNNAVDCLYTRRLLCNNIEGYLTCTLSIMQWICVKSRNDITAAMTDALYKRIILSRFRRSTIERGLFFLFFYELYLHVLFLAWCFHHENHIKYSRITKYQLPGL